MSESSRVLGAIGNVVRQVRLFEDDFLRRAQSMDLNTLVNEYQKAREIVERAEMKVRLELESVKTELREYVLKRILEEVDKHPLNELLELAKRSRVLDRFLDKVSVDRVVNSLGTLGLDQLILLYREAPKFRNAVSEELVRRLKTSPCEVAEKYVREVLSHSTRYDRDTISKLFESLLERIECPEVLGYLLYDVIRVHGVYSDKEAVEALRRITDRAIKLFDRMPCRKHLELLNALAESRTHLVSLDDREKALQILKEYASVIVRNFGRCTIQDVLADMFELKHSLHIYVDRRVYAEAVLGVLTRETDAVKPSVVARIVDVLCKLGSDCCCLVLDKLGLEALAEISKRALELVRDTGIGELGNVSIVASFARVLDTCGVLGAGEVRAVVADICRYMDEVWAKVLNCVSNPTSSFELVKCTYWLHVLGRDAVSAPCGRQPELPSVNLERVSEIIGRDLAIGADVFKLRDAIKKLEEVNTELYENFMKIFDKQRRNLGITLKTLLALLVKEVVNIPNNTLYSCKRRLESSAVYPETTLRPADLVLLQLVAVFATTSRSLKALPSRHLDQTQGVPVALDPRSLSSRLAFSSAGYSSSVCIGNRASPALRV